MLNSCKQVNWVVRITRSLNWEERCICWLMPKKINNTIHNELLNSCCAVHMSFSTFVISQMCNIISMWQKIDSAFTLICLMCLVEIPPKSCSNSRWTISKVQSQNVMNLLCSPFYIMLGTKAMLNCHSFCSDPYQQKMTSSGKYASKFFSKIITGQKYFQPRVL